MGVWRILLVLFCCSFPSYKCQFGLDVHLKFSPTVKQFILVHPFDQSSSKPTFGVYDAQNPYKTKSQPRLIGNQEEEFEFLLPSKANACSITTNNSNQDIKDRQNFLGTSSYSTTHLLCNDASRHLRWAASNQPIFKGESKYFEITINKIPSDRFHSDLLRIGIISDAAKIAGNPEYREWSINNRGGYVVAGVTDDTFDHSDHLWGSISPDGLMDLHTGDVLGVYVNLQSVSPFVSFYRKSSSPSSLYHSLTMSIDGFQKIKLFDQTTSAYYEVLDLDGVNEKQELKIDNRIFQFELAHFGQQVLMHPYKNIELKLYTPQLQGCKLDKSTIKEYRGCAVFMERGMCNFYEKGMIAQQLGAVVMVVGNNLMQENGIKRTPADLSMLIIMDGGSTEINEQIMIPSVFVNYADSQTIIKLLSHKDKVLLSLKGAVSKPGHYGQSHVVEQGITPFVAITKNMDVTIESFASVPSSILHTSLATQNTKFCRPTIYHPLSSTERIMRNAYLRSLRRQLVSPSVHPHVPYFSEKRLARSVVICNENLFYEQNPQALLSSMVIDDIIPTIDSSTLLTTWVNHTSLNVSSQSTSVVRAGWALDMYSDASSNASHRCRDMHSVTSLDDSTDAIDFNSRHVALQSFQCTFLQNQVQSLMLQNYTASIRKRAIYYYEYEFEQNCRDRNNGKPLIAHFGVAAASLYNKFTSEFLIGTDGSWSINQLDYGVSSITHLKSAGSVKWASNQQTLYSNANECVDSTLSFGVVFDLTKGSLFFIDKNKQEDDQATEWINTSIKQSDNKVYFSKSPLSHGFDTTTTITSSGTKSIKIYPLPNFQEQNIYVPLNSIVPIVKIVSTEGVQASMIARVRRHDYAYASRIMNKLVKSASRCSTIHGKSYAAASSNQRNSVQKCSAFIPNLFTWRSF